MPTSDEPKRSAAIDLSFGEIGSTGLKRYSGYISEEFLPALQGQKATRVYQEMADNDPVVGALLFAIEMLIRQVEWPVEAASEDPEDQADKDFLQSCFDDMDQPWTETVAEILTMLTYGWSWHELVYKVRMGQQDDPSFASNHDDNLIGWRKFAIRAQDTLLRWEFDEAGDVTSMIQWAPPDFKQREIPWGKSLLFRPRQTKGNPEGRSMLRNAYRPWYIKKHIENIEAIGVERDLAGMPVAWVPPELLQRDAAADQVALLAMIKKIVTNVKRDEQEGIVFPLVYDEKGNKQYDLTLMTSGGRRNFDTTAIVNRYDQKIAMTALADFILLGHEKVGSFALSSSKTNLFSTAIGSILDSICEVINRNAVPKLFLLNGRRRTKYPKLTHGDIESADLTELAAFVTSLSQAGATIFPDQELQNHLMRQAGLPTTQHAAPMTQPATNAPGADAPEGQSAQKPGAGAA